MRFSPGRRARLIILGCLGLAVAGAGASVAARQPQEEGLSALAERLNVLAREKLRVQQKLRGVKRRQRQVSRELSVLDARLLRAEARLRQTAGNVSRARAEIEETAQQCEAAAARLADHRQNVSDRLVAIYEQGEVRPIEVLLQSTSFADLANRLYLLNQVTARDAELLEEYEEAREEAEARRAELRDREHQLVGLQQRIAADKRRASAERKTTARKKQTILRDRAGWERALAELEQDSHEIEEMLQELQRTPEGQERLTKPWRGKLLLPVEGRITSGFGYRRHPIYRVRKKHTGIDMGASTGTPIRAAAPGTVVHSARWGGYGNCVIIDHGGGLATLYGHCSRLAVKNGKTVKQGEVIAYVGSTGLSTGPHLHFEVRRDGRPVDPMPFL